MPAHNKKQLATPKPKGLSLRHQQLLLNIFSSTFDETLSSEDFPKVLQEIKQALFNREFSTAFGKQEYLEAYAARWSPTRALCYATVLDLLKDEIASLNTLKMICIGGGAAEQVALASYFVRTETTGSLTLLDSAPWKPVCDSIQTSLTSAPPLSKYASAAAKAASQILIPESSLSVSVLQEDALLLTSQQWADIIGTEPVLFTVMFTLNELFTAGGIGQTTSFLNKMTAVLPKGSLFLVVDSPGSYSEVTVGKEERKYPMKWLLEHAMDKSQELHGTQWTLVAGEDSAWFRLDEELSYPFPLEDMRYQIALYRLGEIES